MFLVINAINEIHPALLAQSIESISFLNREL